MRSLYSSLADIWTNFCRNPDAFWVYGPFLSLWMLVLVQLGLSRVLLWNVGYSPSDDAEGSH